MKTRNLTAEQLHYYVAQIENRDVIMINGKCTYVGHVDTWKVQGTTSNPLTGQLYNPTERWGYSGPIIARERISIQPYGKDEWSAELITDKFIGNVRDKTPLLAAMRVYVLSKLGEDVPEIDEDKEAPEIKGYK